MTIPSIITNTIFRCEQVGPCPRPWVSEGLLFWCVFLEIFKVPLQGTLKQALSHFFLQDTLKCSTPSPCTIHIWGDVQRTLEIASMVTSPGPVVGLFPGKRLGLWKLISFLPLAGMVFHKIVTGGHGRSSRLRTTHSPLPTLRHVWTHMSALTCVLRTVF